MFQISQPFSRLASQFGRLFNGLWLNRYPSAWLASTTLERLHLGRPSSISRAHISPSTLNRTRPTLCSYLKTQFSKSHRWLVNRYNRKRIQLFRAEVDVNQRGKRRLIPSCLELMIERWWLRWWRVVRCRWWKHTVVPEPNHKKKKKSRGKKGKEKKTPWLINKPRLCRRRRKATKQGDRLT